MNLLKQIKKLINKEPENAPTLVVGQKLKEIIDEFDKNQEQNKTLEIKVADDISITEKIA